MDISPDQKLKLIQMVKRIQTSSGCMMDLDGLINQFENAVPNPSASQWIFDPPDGKRKTPEEIVDLAMRVL